jgi:type 2 lantibiotic biosynthesis protein LanM
MGKKQRMDPFFERLAVRAATIDELLSDDFETLPGQKAHSDLAAQRLSAWCQSCASGDWSMFNRRLERDGLSLAHVLGRFATVRRRASATLPAWIEDAIWIEGALQGRGSDAHPEDTGGRTERYPFEGLFWPVVQRAGAWLRADAVPRTSDKLSETAHECLRLSLLKALSNHCAPALYERFAKLRDAEAPPANPGRDASRQDAGTAVYDRFIADMRGGGFRRLFEEKAVLLRTMAIIARQWIDVSREFITRLDADWAAIGHDLLSGRVARKVDRIEGDLSDLHNGGRSVQIVQFEDGSRVVYKPKDLRLDAAWRELVERLNRSGAPNDLRAARSIVRDGYGWAEFIEHGGCADQEGVRLFFRRAGAWLALFHCFAAADMHQENLIACADHPVPIDIEVILQAVPGERRSVEPEAQGFEASAEIIANSIMMVGLLPAFGRTPNNDVFAVGGLNPNWQARKEAFTWINTNTDAMRPVRPAPTVDSTPNVPRLDNEYVRFGDHIDDFVVGFEDYARFVSHKTRDEGQGFLFDGFAGLSVRKVVRPTSFYTMLGQRLRNHRTMGDGVIWSAQADFLARLADWEKGFDPFWPLQRCERSALLALNVPYFVSPGDGKEIRDASGVSVPTQASSGLDHARARLGSLDEQEIAWQVEIIRQNTISTPDSAAKPTIIRTPRPLLRSGTSVAPTRDVFIAEAGRIAGEISSYAIRRGSSAAWIGLDWLGDSEVAQLVPLGLDLYGGVTGIAVFLAAHAASARCESSAELAIAATAHLRKNLRGRNAARLARAFGLGGATGLGSVVYALTLMARLLEDDELLGDALVTADLFTDDLIAADRQFDIVGGSAGAIVALLRLYRDSRSRAVLGRAVECGEHLLRQPRHGPEGRRSWVGQGVRGLALNGISHGAAGFAHAFALLAAATEREDFACASAECIAFEDSSFSAEHRNWPRRHADGEVTWPCQWCHGAAGIGLARIAMVKQRISKIWPDAMPDAGILLADIRNALECGDQYWPGSVDTLCCGTLGNIEFIHEAGGVLEREEIRELAAQRSMAVLENAMVTGQYRWDAGGNKFNLGLFRGLAGVGYTLLRRIDGSLPNILVWE